MVEPPELLIARLTKASRVERIACEFGALQFRYWAGPKDGETLLLVHGGSGSWLHWVANIEALTQHYQVWAVDLPGLGASDALPAGYTAEDAVAALVAGCRGLKSLQQYHLVAFSWGCAVSSQAALQLGDAVKSLTLIGPASIGDVSRKGGMKPLQRRLPGMSAADLAALHRSNLHHLMISDPAKIDALALKVQVLNTAQARFNSPKFAKNRMVLDAVRQLQQPVQVIYGDQDGPALPDVASKSALFFAENPLVHFELVANCGHWLAFEQPESFHALLKAWILGCVRA